MDNYGTTPQIFHADPRQMVGSTKNGGTWTNLNVSQIACVSFYMSPRTFATFGF
jgi:hypothetical protein